MTEHIYAYQDGGDIKIYTVYSPLRLMFNGFFVALGALFGLSAFIGITSVISYILEALK